MKRNIFLSTLSVVLCSMFATHLYSQVDTAWVRRYNGPADINDGAQAVAVDHIGNVYVTGYSYGSGFSLDYATIKYDSAGVEQWVQRYDGPGNDWDEACAIAVDNIGNVYVTGLSVGSGTSADGATIKYNSAGVEQWVQRYNGPGNGYDYAFAIAVDGQGNVFVTGACTGSGTDVDYATIKYNSAGVEQWVQRYNGPGNSYDAAGAIAVDNIGNVYVTGSSVGSGTSFDYATIKYDSAGVEQWVQRYNGPGNDEDYAWAIAVDNSGNVYVTGGSPGSGSTDYATIRYNSAGVEQRVQRYDGPGNGWDMARAIAVDGQGNVYVTGQSVGSGTSEDYATIKYDSAGVEQWVQRCNGPGNGSDVANAIAVDSIGSVYVTGSSVGSGTSEDYATIKYDSAGQEQWVQRYDGPGNNEDHAKAIAVDNSGNVYVTGESDVGTNEDYATIKYVQTQGIEENRLPLSVNRSSIEIFPNPAKTYFTVRWTSTLFGQTANSTELKIFDCLGKMVREIATPSQFASQNIGTRYALRNDEVRELRISLKGISPGIYFIQIGDETKNTKLVIAN